MKRNSRRKILTIQSQVLATVAALFWGATSLRADLIDDEPAGTPAAPAKGHEKNPDKSPSPKKEDGKSPTGSATGGTPQPASGKSGRTNTGVLAPKGSKDGKKKKRDGDQPVHFESNGAKAFQQDGILELLDNVVVTQGTMRLEADYAKVFYDESKKDVDRVIAQGNVKMFKIDEDSGEKIQALGDQVTFLNQERRVTMEGNARLWRGADLVRGKKITYEMDSGWIKADRVVGEVHPNSEKPEKLEKDAVSPDKTETAPPPSPAPSPEATEPDKKDG